MATWKRYKPGPQLLASLEDEGDYWTAYPVDCRKKPPLIHITPTGIKMDFLQNILDVQTILIGFSSYVYSCFLEEDAGLVSMQKRIRDFNQDI